MIKRTLAIAAAGLSLLAATPAFADHWRHDRGWHGHGYGHRHYYRPYGVVVMPPAPVYYAPAPVYYAPPRVVYQPPVYVAPRPTIVYRQPGLSVAFGL